MTVELRLLRVEAAIEAQKYVSGANQKAVADDKMVSSGRKVVGTLEQTDRKLGETGTRFERLARSVDPAYAAQQKMEAGARTLQRALDTGKITVERHAQLMDMLRQRYGAVPQAVNGMSTAMLGATQQSRSMQFALTNLSFQVNDVVTGLASGQDAFRIFAQQGGQFVQLFQQGGGVTSVLSAATATIRGMITPMTVAAAGVAALAGGAAVLVSRLISAESSIRQFDLTFSRMGTSSLVASTDLEAAARRLRDVGLSAAEARVKILDVGRAGLNPAAAEQVIRTGANVGAVLGGDGVQTVISALTGGIEPMLNLAQAFDVVSQKEAVAAREMAKLGQESRIVNELFRRITVAAAGADREALSPMAKAMRDLSVAWNGLMDTLANNRALLAVVEAMTAFANAVDRLAQGKLSPEQSSKLGGAVGGVISGVALGRYGGLPGMIGGGIAGGVAGYQVGGAMAPQTVAQAGVPIDMHRLVQAVIEVESRGRANAISSAGAMGLMQLMPGTARQYGVSNPFDGGQNVAGGTKYLQDLLKKYGGDVELALMAYNWGPGNLDKALAGQKKIPASVKAYASQVVGLADSGGPIGGSVFAHPNRDFERFAAEQEQALQRLSEAAQLEISNNLFIAAGYEKSAASGMKAEAMAQALTETYARLRTTTGELADEQIKQRALDLEYIARGEQIRKFARDSSRDRQDVDVLQLQARLQGQTTEEISRQVALLRVKQEAEAVGLDQTDRAVQNRLREVDALQQANAQLVEAQRNQQRMDDLFRSIGDTISRTIGDAIAGIFDKDKVVDWGKALKSAVSSIASQIAQSLVIRPLTGELLAGLGASPNVVQQYGTFGGGSGSGGLGLGTLLQGGGLLKDIFGLGGGGSGGGLFSGVSDFFGGGLGGIFAHTPMDFGGGGAALGVADVFGGSTVPGSIFGSTTFGGALGGLGLGMGAGGLINSLMGGNSMFGTIGSGLGSLVGMVGGPIGSLIGGALGGLFGGLFGNKKPRNQSAGGNIDFATGRVFDMFSGGNPQIDQATHAVIQQLGGFTQRLLQLSGGRLSGEVLLQNGVNTGFTADSSLPGYEGRFNLGRDPAEAVRVVSLALARSLEDISGTMRHVIDQVSDPAKLESALQFAATYERIDEAFRGAFAEIDPERVGPFAQAMAQINAIFADMTAKAGEFGLALDPVTAGLDEATRRLRGDFTEALDRVFNEASGSGFLNQIDGLVEALSQSRAEAEAIGLGGDAGTQALIDRVFGAQLESILSGLDAAQLQQVSTSFTELDASIVALIRSAEDAAAATTQLAEAEQQAQAIIAAGASIRDYVASLSATAPGLSPEAALAGAQSLYAETLAAAQAGDVDAYNDLVSISQQLIDATEAYYASGAETAAAVAQVSSDLLALPGVAEDADINELTLQLIDAQRETTDAILTLDLTTQAVSASLLNLIALNDQIAAAAAASNEALAAELIAGVEAASAAMILQLDADAAEIVAAMEGGTALLLAESAAQTEALIASNAATVADITARNAEDSAALIAGNEAVTAAITALNDMLAQTLFDANIDAAEGIISENTAATGELIAANDSATTAIITQYSASANELLAGASQDAQAVAASVYDIGDEISLVMTSATNNLMLATANGANSIIEADAVFSNSEIAAITTTATNSVTAAGEFSSNEISAVTNGANSIVEAAGAFSSNEIAALGSGIASLLAAGLEYANGIVAAIGSGASSLIAAGSSYTSSLITAITDTTSNLINTEGIYANNQLVAVYETTAAVRETTTAVRDATGWMQQIRDTTAAYGDVANDQRNTMIGLLQQIASTVGMLSSGGSTWYDPGPGSDGGGSDSGY